jgi:RES domain-containing protein
VSAIIRLIVTVPASTVVYRARSHVKTDPCATREALGSPPKGKAVSNRMSAVGISVFYGAFDMDTAAVEACASMPRKPEWVLTGAAWNCTRSPQVLDLSGPTSAFEHF